MKISSKRIQKGEIIRDGLDDKTAARIIQAVVFFIGLIEEFDPIDLDYTKIVKYVSDLLRA